MIRKIAVALIILLLIAGGLAGIKFMQVRKLIKAAGTFAPPPVAVSSAVARQDKWQSTLTAIGSITAEQGVVITPELPGTVREIAFDSGAVVTQSNLLVRLDVSSEEAQLRAVQAQWELARLNLERVRTLRQENNIVSQADLDAAEATMKQNQANAEAIQSTIDKKTIRAPFAGKLGIRMINLGQYIDTGKPIVSLQSLSPVHADFSLRQQELARLKTGMPIRLTTDAYPNRYFEGRLTAINPDLDPSTRSVGLQATFDNPEQLLRPGMFARVEVLLPEEQDVLVIPATSVLPAPYGDSVYLIEPQPGRDGKAQLMVRQQLIRTGRARGDFLSVVSGLKAGDRVVSAGLFKLRAGIQVIENNELAPKAETAPRPADS
jgi:membrane fusion protein (multidrug efflux system)